MLLGSEDLGPLEHRSRISWGRNQVRNAEIQSKMVPGNDLEVARGGLYCFEGWVPKRSIITIWDPGSTLKVELWHDCDYVYPLLGP